MEMERSARQVSNTYTTAICHTHLRRDCLHHHFRSHTTCTLHLYHSYCVPVLVLVFGAEPIRGVLPAAAGRRPWGRPVRVKRGAPVQAACLGRCWVRISSRSPRPMETMEAVRRLPREGGAMVVWDGMVRRPAVLSTVHITAQGSRGHMGPLTTATPNAPTLSPFAW